MTVEDLERILPPHLGQWSRQLAAAELCYNIDVLTLAAIMDRESRGGDALTPKGAVGTGDRGHGRGLLQVDDRTHLGFCWARFYDGTPIWADPNFNVLMGARILSTNLNSCGGNYPVAIAGYNCGMHKALKAVGTEALAQKRLELLDSVTTGGNYVSDVLAKVRAFQAKEGVAQS